MELNTPAKSKKVKPPQRPISSKNTIADTKYIKPAINDKIPTSTESVTTNS